jgi:hypothetical protein
MSLAKKKMEDRRFNMAKQQIPGAKVLPIIQVLPPPTVDE